MSTHNEVQFISSYEKEGGESHVTENVAEGAGHLEEGWKTEVQVLSLRDFEFHVSSVIRLFTSTEDTKRKIIEIH